MQGGKQAGEAGQQGTRVGADHIASVGDEENEYVRTFPRGDPEDDAIRKDHPDIFPNASAEPTT